MQKYNLKITKLNTKSNEKRNNFGCLCFFIIKFNLF